MEKGLNIKRNWDFYRTTFNCRKANKQKEKFWKRGKHYINFIFLGFLFELHDCGKWERFSALEFRTYCSGNEDLTIIALVFEYNWISNNGKILDFIGKKIKDLWIIVCDIKLFWAFFCIFFRSSSVSSLQLL